MTIPNQHRRSTSALLFLPICFLLLTGMVAAAPDGVFGHESLDELLSAVEAQAQQDPQKALATLESALAELELDEQPEAAVKLLNRRAELLRDQGETEQALLALELAEDLAVQLDDPVPAVQVQQMRGTIYLDRADFDRALEINMAVLNQAQALAHAELEAAARNAIGNIYFSLEQPERARRFYRAAAEIYEELDSRERLGSLLGNIGNTYNSEGRYQEALPYQRQSLRIARQEGREIGAAYQLINLCNTLWLLERMEDARGYCREGIPLLEDAGHYRALHFALNLMGDLRVAEGDPEAALSYLLRALEIAREMDSPRLREASHGDLSSLYETLGDYQAALEHARAQFEAHHEVMDSERQQRIVELEQSYEAELRRQEITAREAEISRLELESELKEASLCERQTLMLVAFSLFVATAIVALLLWRGYMLRRRSSRRIEEKNRELNEALKTISRLARQDPLTGLANRRRLMEVLKSELSRRHRTGAPLTLALGDIDYFKQLNDQYGHQVGDQILMGLAKRMRSCLRESDLLCRWGGEEFLILMPETDAEEARLAMEKVCAAVAAKPFETDAGPVEVTITFGVASVRGDDFKSAVRVADRAMYAGKHQGRNRVMVRIEGGDAE